jgi:hypothetical protein
MTFFKRGGMDLLPEPSLSWLKDVVEAKKQNQKFWSENGESTVELLKMLLASKQPALTVENRKAITTIGDILVDNGVRGAGFLQELMGDS